ncbi:MAG TPA: ESX secretion-associated protein EspG [Pseudonocardiaceae bacterium]|nr:ESX secretion-associated protein EspG [Pseudonocardiaceae bacterium]
MPEIVSLSLPTADLLWEHLALGRLPAPFEIRSVGATESERAGLRAEMWSDLTSRGLATAGRLEKRIADLLAVLARFESAITSLSVLDDGRLMRSIAATDGRRAVLAVQGVRNLHVAGIEPGELAVSIVDLLPAAHPFPGRPVTIQDSDDDKATPMLASPRRRAGYFIAKVRVGTHTSSELAWVDTDLGRFSSRYVRDPTGARCTAHTHVGRDELVAQLTQLLAKLTTNR